MANGMTPTLKDTAKKVRGRNNETIFLGKNFNLHGHKAFYFVLL